MNKLSIIDTGFLLTESHHSPKHVAAVQIFELPKGKGAAWLRRMLDQLRQVPPGYPFDQRLHVINPLQHALVTDDKLEMDYHVRHSVLPSPGNDDQLWDLVARMHANLLDRERPLWEFHLIEGLSNRRFAFYTKLHHCLGDGMTMNRWFTESGSFSADDMESHPIWQRERPPEPAPADEPGYLQLIVEGIKTLGGGVKTAFDLTSLSAKLVQRRFWEGNRNVILPFAAPRTRLNVATGAARNLASASFPLALFRDIAKSQGVSINDVLMTVCDMAVNCYFQDKGEALEEPLVVYMPVNLRDAAEPGAGNMISLLQVRLASDHWDPLTALKQVQASSKIAREIFTGFGKPAIQIYALVVALLAQFEETLKLDKLLPPAMNLVISNVPGPKQQMYFRGARAISAFPISTLPPLTALNVTANSYAGNLHIGLVSGRTALPDLKALSRHMEESVAILADAAEVAVPDA
jgi:diacylglycerol O-acyltransferase